MEILVVCVVAFLASLLTFFSGFGLGTLLTPIFMLFFPAELAIACTGVVHFFNNVFKITLVGRHADRAVVIRFGIPAILSAIAGAWLLSKLSSIQPIMDYSLFGKTIEIYPVKFIIGVLLLVFALMDIIPYFKKLEFNRDKLAVGGALSGFFGGLSGNQGALRSAFLIRTGLSKEAFVATTVVVSTLVDISRLSLYYTHLSSSLIPENITLVSLATIAAITGAFIGNRILKKVTLDFVRNLVAILLITLSLVYISGLL